jgi:pyridoxal/pyridoxine/pyridoxamine kinase
MGDQGSLYVPASFVSLYRDRMMPLADVVTPNQTEIECVPCMHANQHSFDILPYF